jgi:hypothetical protein
VRINSLELDLAGLPGKLTAASQSSTGVALETLLVARTPD